MPTTDAHDGGLRAVDELPRFELEYLVDDLDRPTRIMIVPKRGHGPEQWISIEREHAVPLEDVR